MNFFIKENTNIVIDRKLNDSWTKIDESEVIRFLDKKGLTWHKDLQEDEIFVWEEDELLDGNCRVLSVQNADNLNEYSMICPNFNNYLK